MTKNAIKKFISANFTMRIKKLSVCPSKFEYIKIGKHLRHSLNSVT